MAKATPFSVMAGGLRGYTEGKRWREELEEKKRQRDLQDKLVQLQLELRRMQALKPTETSYGTVSPIDIGTQGPGWMPATMETPMEQIGWQTTPRPGGDTGLTPEQKAQLGLKYKEKWWDYQVGHPKPTAQERGAEAKTDQQFLAEFARVRDDHRMLQAQIRMMQAQELPVPAWMHRGLVEMDDWMKANTAKRDKLIGATAPSRKAVGATPSGQPLFSNTALKTPPGFVELTAFMEAARKKLLEKKPIATPGFGPFGRAGWDPKEFAEKLAEIRQEWMDEVAKYWRVHGGKAK